MLMVLCYWPNSIISWHAVIETCSEVYIYHVLQTISHLRVLVVANPDNVVPLDTNKQKEISSCGCALNSCLPLAWAWCWLICHKHEGVQLR